MQKKILNSSIRILSVIVLFTLGVKLQSCDDKHYNLTYTGHIVPHCNDGIQDYDETGVDCGGADCKPCVVVVNVPCTTTLNTMTMTLGFSISSFTLSASGSVLSNGNYAVTCVYDAINDTVYFKFPSKPSADGVYTMVSSTSVSANNVYSDLSFVLGYYDPFVTNPSWSNSYNIVYVKIINGKINIYECEADYYDYTGDHIYISPLHVQVN